MIDLGARQREAEQAIRAAFPVGVAPSGAAMRNEHCPECRETVARFAGKPWSNLTPDDLRGNPDPGALTDVGFRYYLPAMMLLALQFPRELDCLPDCLIGALSPKGSTPAGEHLERLAFTQAQAAAVLAFLLAVEASRRVEWAQRGWPEEAVLSAPLGRPLERALRFWKARAAAAAAPSSDP